MKTYLNEIHQQYKDNNNQYANYREKIDINLPSNKLTKNKSGLFLNNFFRATNTNNKKNEKIYNSFKKSTNSNNSNKTFKNYKKKKKINVTPYQGIKNEYILNLAMDNLNKYQENLLLKENHGENWSEDKLYLNLNLNNENESNNINNINNISNQSHNLDFNSVEKNKRINILNRNSPLEKSIMNKTQDNFGRHKDSYYNNYYISDDLFNYNDNMNDNTRSKDYQKNNISKPVPYISSKSIINNDSNNDYNNNSNININYEKDYENKFNSFINKEFNLKNENSKNTSNKNKNKNKEGYDEKLIFVLTSLELNELIKIFEQNFIYFDDLFLLTKEDFIEMKIPIGPRNRIINFMEKYKNIGKTYDLEELSSFMEKYKQILINSNDNDNFNVTPSTNNKYKSTTTSENNKNKGSFDSRGSDLPGKRLNMSNFNFEDAETLSPRLEEKQPKKSINPKSKNRNRNRNQEYDVNVDNKNKMFNDINQIINETNLNSYENNKNNELQKNDLYNKEKSNNNNSNSYNNINTKKFNSSRTKDNNNNNNQKQNINNDDNSNFNLNFMNNENINNGNIFSNSLFNEFSRNINDINETLNMNNINETNNNLNNNKNAYNKNSSFNNENINNITSTNSSNVKDNNKSEFSNLPSAHLLNAKKNYSYKNNNISNANINQNTYKTFQNIFSEIENYQMNYEKMKKENDNRNNKINNLLEKKNRPNIQYLKMKIKNSKYYNEEDLKNESVRDLKSELEKMNFHKENDNNELSGMKYNPAGQNYLKARNSRSNNNPLIEEFNKHK